MVRTVVDVLKIEGQVSRRKEIDQVGEARGGLREILGVIEEPLLRGIADLDTVVGTRDGLAAPLGFRNPNLGVGSLHHIEILSRERK